MHVLRLWLLLVNDTSRRHAGLLGVMGLLRLHGSRLLRLHLLLLLLLLRATAGMDWCSTRELWLLWLLTLLQLLLLFLRLHLLLGMVKVSKYLLALRKVRLGLLQLLADFCLSLCRVSSPLQRCKLLLNLRFGSS